MASFNPFEIRNPPGEGRMLQLRDDDFHRQHHHRHYNHEGSPLLRSEELSDEEVTRLLFKTKPRRKIPFSLLIKGAVLVVCSVAILTLGWVLISPREAEKMKMVPSVEVQAHRPHYLPTLLSVVDPDSNHSFSVYALNNTLYNQMLYSADYDDDYDRLDEKRIRPSRSDTKTVQQQRQQEQQQRINRGRCQTDCELPQIWLDKSTIDVNGNSNRNDDGDGNDDSDSSSITLTWTMGRDGTNGNVILQDCDVIALYCISDGDSDDGAVNPRTFLEAATIAQARATSARNGGSHHDNAWFIPRFPILRQESCHFRLYLVSESTTRASTRRSDASFSTSWWQYDHVASSEPLTIQQAKETPTAIHLAYSDTYSTMVVQFTTGHRDAIPVVRYARIPDNHQTTVDVIPITHFETAAGTSETYTSNDMCQEPANQTEAGKFYPPGMLHTVMVNNLQPSTRYQYQVGIAIHDVVSQWSEPSTFRTAPKDGDDSEFSYIVYGDQGCPETGCHDGEKWLSAMMDRERDVTSVHHFGDISYANGAAHVWDAWFEMIKPFSTKVPLMIAIGNHEYDHTAGGKGKDPSGMMTEDGYQPSWGNFLVNDSGGECGVPMAKRFRMPSSSHNSNGVFWYSYNHGMVHTVVISSEHDLSIGSRQYLFIEKDLERVDRSITPWVVLESHRPLYEGESGEHWMSNEIVGTAMRDEIEDLLLVHNVDLVLAGHYHEYHRTCNGLYRGICDSNGPVHITIGAAGAALDNFYADTTVYDKPWTARYLPGVYGYGKLHGNATALQFSFVRHGDNDDPHAGEVLDSFRIPRR